LKLPGQEKRSMNKRLRFILKRSFFLILIIALEIIIINKIFNFSVLDNKFVILVYVILVVPVILLYTIIVLLSKLVFSKYNLRKANKFQTRLIISFAIIALIPIIPLTVLTYNLFNQSLEIWLTKPIEQSLDSGLNFVSTIFEEKKQKTKHYLNLLSKKNIIKNVLIFGINDTYKKTINSIARKNMIHSLFILDSKNKLIYEIQREKLIKDIYFTGLRNTLDKKNIYIENKNIQENEYLLGYTYIYDSDVTKKVLGILIIGEFLPINFSKRANKIAASLQSYKQMELYKKPIIKAATLFIIIIITLIVFLVAIIVSYFISKNITEPIKILLDGTKKIVAGDLNFEIKYNAKDEIKLLINAFNHMTRELQASKQALTHSQRLAAWRDIARRIAHEIRNPLTPIKLSIERLLVQSKANNFQQILKKSSHTILEEVNRLEQLIKEFSDFAKAPQLQMEIENLNHIIVDTLDIFAGVKTIKFKTQLEKELPLMNLDKKRTKEALINLINNAIESADSKNILIKIKTYSKTNIFGKFVYLEIEDNGKGISKDRLVKIFDPYFTTKKEGTGLGLTIVEKILTEHHAKIKCESEQKKGTKFIIEYPL